MLSEQTAELFVNGIKALKTYYINSRATDNGVTHFVAYDFNGDSDKSFDTSSIPQTSEDFISIGTAASIAASTMGYSAVFNNLDNANVPKKSLEGKTCLQVLEMIAESVAGTWIVEGERQLVCYTLNKDINQYPEYQKINTFAPINWQGTQTITALIHKNSDTENIEIFGNESLKSGSLIEVNNSIVAGEPSIGASVWGRIGNIEYVAWSCENSLLDTIDLISSSILNRSVVLGENMKLIIGNYEMKIDSTGIYLSMGRSPQTDEYRNKVDRDKIGVDKPIGNATITSAGRIEYHNYNPKE